MDVAKTDGEVSHSDDEIRRRSEQLAREVEAHNAEVRARVVAAYEAEQAERGAARAALREAERKHKSERPQRWAALPREAKIFYVAAAQRPMKVREALVTLAKLATYESRLIEVPESFEEE
jgi:hypothetical protein